MDIKTICVLGGSGFVGSHICAALAARGYHVRVATRNRERAKQLILLPTVEVVVAEIHDQAELARVMQGCDAVINLVGVLHNGRGHASFHEAHVELAKKVIAACREAGIRRLLHMSALNAATTAPSEYLKTKGEAETVVRNSGLDTTIFRPSVVFGPEDSFLNLFAFLQKFFPMVFLGSANARFQPVYVGDVAAAFVASLERLDSHAASYDLCGPRVYTLRELVEYTGRVTRHERPVIALGDRLSYLQAYTLELVPFVKLLTRDNYWSMKIDNVSNNEFPFGIKPGALEALAPAWLVQRTPRGRYMILRDRAHR